MRGTCDSCGRDDEERWPVRRTYVVPQTWETEGSSHTLDEVEWWCFPCCSHYPHQPASEVG